MNNVLKKGTINKMIIRTVFTCEYCGKNYSLFSECAKHEKECDYHISFYDKYQNRINLNEFENIKYIYIPTYKEYIKFTEKYPATAILNKAETYAYPVIIEKDNESKWHVLPEYFKEVAYWEDPQ